MDRDEQVFHTPEDIMMRNQVLNLRIRELEKRVQELEAERKTLGRRVASAHIVLYDYDGFYNPETKQGNIEQLASLVDDAMKILSGAEDGMYGGRDGASGA